MASGIGHQVGQNLQTVIDWLTYPEPKTPEAGKPKACRFIDDSECPGCEEVVVPSNNSASAVVSLSNSADVKDSEKAKPNREALLKRIVVHKTCPPMHAKCMEAWLTSSANKTHACLNCREQTWIPGLSELPPAPPPPPAPPEPTMQERLIQWRDAGFTATGQGLKWILPDVLIALFVAAVLASGAVGFAQIVDPAPLSLLVRGPVLGALVGTFFGSAITSAFMHGDSLIGDKILYRQKNNQPPTPRWRPFVHGAITLALTGIALFTAYKVAFIAGTFLTTEWIASCVSFNQISSVLTMAWELIPVSGSLQAGLSSTCAMTIAQVETFGIATFASIALIGIKRVLCEKLPREWNSAKQYALRVADGMV